ncbi:MAG: DUF422 domain-containing protein [Clostridia bacterium]|nr:DUF422 domain-containing protein [Clostridia bacterium]
MNWLNAFELMCYLIVGILLADLIRHKDYHALFTFGAAALVGFFMELAAVAVTDIYCYSPDFWLNLGKVPKQFPLFGGLMWGGLTVCGIRLAEKFRFGKWMTAFTAGMCIVTMDILLDVVAIRLDGGFWTWLGQPIHTEITQSTFLSVIWVNFLGYMIETPTVVLLTQLKNERVKPHESGKQTVGMLLIALGAIVVTAAGSLAALGLNALTDDWFSCIAFVLLWGYMVVAIVRQAVRQKLRPAPLKKWNVATVIFWLAMYAYCIIAVAVLGLAQELPWFLAMGLLFAGATMYASVSEPTASSENH